MIKGYFEYEYNLNGEWKTQKQAFKVKELSELSFYKRTVLQICDNIRNIKTIFKGN